LSERIVLAYRLRDGVSPQAYEAWVETEDAPYAMSRPTVLGFTITRLERNAAGGTGLPFDYIEILDVTDASLDRAETDNARGRELTGQWQQFTENAAVITAHEVLSFRKTGSGV
jgi:hypothetical protein